MNKVQEYLLCEAYKKNLAQAKIPAPTPLPPPVSLPSVGATRDLSALIGASAIRGIKLSPERDSYYVLLAGGFFANCRQSGHPLKQGSHFLDVYSYGHLKVTPEEPTKVYSILKLKPFARLLTRPFFFLVKSDATRAIRATLETLVQP